MEYSLSASTAVLPLAARSLGVSIESGAGVPGDQITVDEETFIIKEDGAFIPVPVGTIATLLPDSDEEESVEEKHTVSNSQNTVSTSVAAVASFATVSDVHSCSDGPSCSDPSVATPLVTDLLALPVTNSSLSDQAEATMESSKNDESDISDLTEGNSASIADTLSTAVESSVQQLDSSSGPGSGEIPAVAGVSDSDLYVQEEEEVTMDEASVDADVSSTETAAVTNAPATMVASVSNSDSNDAILGKTNKKAVSKKTTKNAVADVNDIAENSNSKISTKVNTKENVPSLSQHSSPEKGPEKAHAASPAVSASGRPQRNTPRRSAIDMLKGSDIKPARRSVAELETEQPVLKKPKAAAAKKNAEPAAVLPAEEEKTSAESPVSRGRGRRKVSESTVGSSASVHSQPKSASSSMHVNSLDTSELQDEESVLNNERILAGNVKSKRDVDTKLDEKEQKANALKLEDSQLESQHEVAKMNGAIQEQVVNKYCGTKQDLESSATISNSAVTDNSVATSSVSRGRRKKDATEGSKDQRNDCQSSVDNSAKPNGDTVGQELRQPAEKKSELIKSDNQIKCNAVSGDRVTIADSCKGSAAPCETAVDSSSDFVGLPGFSYDSFVTGHSSKKIAEVKSRTKNIKARNRKEKLENHLGTSHDGGKDVLDVSRAKLPNVESMQARIRELEAEVERLQVKLSEVTGASESATGSITKKGSNQKSQKETDVLVDLPTDERSALDRWENKLRKLDRELEEKRTELIVKVGCITRYERQVLEKEKRLKRLEASLNLRRQQAACGNVEDVSKDGSAVAIADVPLFLTGRVNLHAEEQKLELRRQELERQKNFLEDEKKKLVAKERELETREQAAVDADLFSIASVFKTNESSTSVTVAAKQANGKMDVDFSDDDDGFGAGVQQFAFSSAGHSPMPGSVTKDDTSSEEDEEIPLAEILSSRKGRRKSVEAEDDSLTSNDSLPVSAATPSKRRRVEADVVDKTNALKHLA